MDAATFGKAQMRLACVSESFRSADCDPPTYTPAMPRTAEETGLPFLFLAQHACKILYRTGPQRVIDLAERAKLAPGALEPVIEFLCRETLCEVSGTRNGAGPAFTLTDFGRERAEGYLHQCEYAGPAPVSLDAYRAQVWCQAIADLGVTRERMKTAFSGIVIRADILEQFGAAMNSGRAIFVYGPAGSGKSFVSRRLARLLAGDVCIPYAILVENQVIQVFDPLVHTTAQVPGADTAALARGRASDARWVRCRRPVVVSGAELTLDMLDLQFDEGTRDYAAPPQVKANNGVLIVDDLGRQRVPARDLMNRWMVPLDRRVDFLALKTGEKFMVPFDVTVIFCTDISPAQLADDAFLRRLGYKIQLEPLDEMQYREVCRQVCASLGIPYQDPAIDYLLERYRREARPLLACTPRDILAKLRDQARYRGAAPELTEELLDWACDNCFVHEAGKPMSGMLREIRP